MVVAFVFRYIEMFANSTFVPYNIEDNTYGMVDRMAYVPEVASHIKIFDTFGNFCRYLAITW